MIDLFTAFGKKGDTSPPFRKTSLTKVDATEVKWIQTRNIKEPMANTYQNIKDILSVFFDTP